MCPLGSFVDYSAEFLIECADTQTQAALSSLTSTGCQIADVGCICKDQSFINSLLPVVEKACDPADLQSSSCDLSIMRTVISDFFTAETVDFAETFCKSAGITLTVPTVAQTTSSATTSTQIVESLITATALQNVTIAGSGTDVQPSSTSSATVAPSKGSASNSQGRVLGLIVLLSLLVVI